MRMLFLVIGIGAFFMCCLPCTVFIMIKFNLVKGWIVDTNEIKTKDILDQSLEKEDTFYQEGD